MTPVLTPAEIEQQIERAARRMQMAFACGQLNKAIKHGEEMQRLIAMRSPETVRRMERERGLR